MIQEDYKEKLSQIFSTARIYALISIVSAHIYFADSFSGQILNRFGTLGVIVFLLISGYYYRPEKFHNWKKLFAKKAVSIGIPWLICGTLTWGYNIILSSQNRSLFGWLNWILGNGSYLYYLTILMLCFIILFKANKVMIWLMIPLSVFSIFLTALDLLQPILLFLRINNYLNVFNWLGFFSLGMLLQTISEEKIVQFLIKSRIWFIALFALVFVTLLFFPEIDTYYFSFLAIPYEFLGGLAILGVATWSLVGHRFFQRLSSGTFTIYLIHIVFIGLLDRVLNIFIVTRFFAPICIILITFFVIIFAKKVAKILKIEKIFDLAIGFRGNIAKSEIGK